MQSQSPKVRVGAQLVRLGSQHSFRASTAASIIPPVAEEDEDAYEEDENEEEEGDDDDDDGIGWSPFVVQAHIN